MASLNTKFSDRQPFAISRCEICHLWSALFHPQILSSMHDNCNVCLDCIQSSISNVVAGRRVRCPSSTCGKPLSVEAVKALVSASEFKEYTRKLQGRKDKRFGCSICLEPQSASAFPRAPLTDSCQHRSKKTCRSCIKKLLAHALDGREWIVPECPDCKAQLAPHDVQRLGTPAQAATFNERLTLRFLRSLPEYRQCPRAGCNSGQLHEGGVESPIVSCRSCGYKTCFVHHGLPWHQGLTCAKYDEKQAKSKKKAKEGILKSEKLVRESTKACPGCLFDIEKINGCDHIQCQKCMYEFCYLCLAKYDDIRKKGNSAHKKSCAHYRS